MRRWKDSTGCQWFIRLNVNAFEALRDATGIDCYKLVEDGLKPLAELLGDVEQFVDVLWEFSKDQAHELTAEAFADRFGGEALEAAADAFVEELLAFFSTKDKPDATQDEASEEKAVVVLGADLERAVWASAGILGIHPGPFTLAQLSRMVEGRRREQWEHTSHLLAWMENIAPFRKGKPTKPQDRNPMLAQKSSHDKPLQLSPQHSIAALAAAWGLTGGKPAPVDPRTPIGLRVQPGRAPEVRQR